MFSPTPTPPDSGALVSSRHKVLPFAALRRTRSPRVLAASTLLPTIAEFARTAKLKTETLRTDPEVFEVWSCFVVASEALCNFQAPPSTAALPADAAFFSQFSELLRAGSVIVSSMARARVPMPKSTRAFVERCDALCQVAKCKKEVPKSGALTSPVRSL